MYGPAHCAPPPALPEHIAAIVDPGERWRAICADGRARRERAVAARERFEAEESGRVARSE